jgi:hypothetical protein
MVFYCLFSSEISSRPSFHGSKVFFNNELFLVNDGLHAADRPVVKLVPLSPGYYPLIIKYFERTGDEVVTLGFIRNELLAILNRAKPGFTV